ncbi:PREDICTED: calcitonin gene-related peptide type 1 receptor-like [Cyprinodon variegatus]|uniref:calcitonin gene-related peptide type 1 receptor-like n=1 Tax=Cyprinodon variegatus TaxID=28743 RepID=UPI00074266C3|nr:PREDICTED: calcitonin gene-related peptide type 1 receptor-like [Cyprinodon variegatus]
MDLGGIVSLLALLSLNKVIKLYCFHPCFNNKAMAEKVCTNTGEWGRHPESNRTWTDFNSCQFNNTDRTPATMTHFYLTMIGHGLSLISLLISLGIFFYFKTLSCERITLHKNLFLSFVLNSVITVTWLCEVRKDSLSNQVNFFFLLNIIRVIITKLRVTHQAESSLYMRAVRATLILIPLLGIQYVLLGYKPLDPWIIEIYLYIMNIAMHYQGLLVSTIFCFFNGEVQTVLRRQWNLLRMQSAGTFANRSAYYVASSLTEVHRCYSIESHTDHINGKSCSDIFRSESPYV